MVNRRLQSATVVLGVGGLKGDKGDPGTPGVGSGGMGVPPGGSEGQVVTWAGGVPAWRRGPVRLFGPPLDIWPEFNANGGVGSWVALTHAEYIAGLDDSLFGPIASGAVVKANLGLSSDGVTPVYSYTAGSGPIPVLLVAGQHGQETLGMWSSMRWFQQFVTSNVSDAQQLRDAFRVTYIPALNSSKYRVSRTNANSVDINRNFDVLWARYNDGGGVGSPTYKGTAAFTEPEAVMMRTLLDGTAYRVVIDCHNPNPTGNTMSFGVAGHWLLGDRRLGYDVMDLWKVIYGSSFSMAEEGPLNTTPSLQNYANWHMRHLKSRADAVTLLLEMSADALGSTTTTVSRGAVQAYAGIIQILLTEVMHNGGRATAQPYVYTWAGNTIRRATTSVASGGTLIDNPAAANLKFVGPTTHLGAVETTSLAVPTLVVPARIIITFTGAVRSLGNPVGRHSLSVAIDGTVIGGISVVSPATTSETSGFAFTASKYITAANNLNPPEVSFPVYKVTGGAAELMEFTYTITVEPNKRGRETPVPTGA